MSERGLTWDAFGLSCPGSPSHIPVPPQQAHRNPASSGTCLRPRCARPCHPSALGGEEMLGPGKAAKKSTFSTQLQWDLTARTELEQGLGSPNLLGLRKGCSHGILHEEDARAASLDAGAFLPGQPPGGLGRRRGTVHLEKHYPFPCP